MYDVNLSFKGNGDLHLYLKLQACRPSKSSILIKIPSLDSRAGRCASAAF